MTATPQGTAAQARRPSIVSALACSACALVVDGRNRISCEPFAAHRDHPMMDLLTSPEAWIAFATLTALELVLGIDNIIFISILVDKLPKAQQEMARRVGLFMAMFMRVGLLLVLAWIVGLVESLFNVLGQAISGRDLILILGGLFLVWKSTTEIHGSMEGEEGHAAGAVKATLAAVLLQIMIIDLVFSLDSIITAVGMVDDVRVMIAAVICSVALMMVFASPIGRFVSAHPTIKVLALSFLVVVGVVLIAEGFDHHVPKGYVYFAMAFSLGVEMINIRVRKRSQRVVQLHSAYEPPKTESGQSQPGQNKA
jgi:predicted tellurium resistance membrane protein TerC